jgi:hypothetical protein
MLLHQSLYSADHISKKKTPQRNNPTAGHIGSSRSQPPFVCSEASTPKTVITAPCASCGGDVGVESVSCCTATWRRWRPSPSRHRRPSIHIHRKSLMQWLTKSESRIARVDGRVCVCVWLMRRVEEGGLCRDRDNKQQIALRRRTNHRQSGAWLAVRKQGGSDRSKNQIGATRGVTLIARSFYGHDKHSRFTNDMTGVGRNGHSGAPTPGFSTPRTRKHSFLTCSRKQKTPVMIHFSLLVPQKKKKSKELKRAQRGPTISELPEASLRLRARV